MRYGSYVSTQFMRISIAYDRCGMVWYDVWMCVDPP